MKPVCIDHGFKANKPGGYHQIRKWGRLNYVHRLAYGETHGMAVDEIPALIRHTCNNPRCINPRHLKPGTHQDNADDRVKAGRSAKALPGKRCLPAEMEATIRARFAIHQQHSASAMANEFGVPVWMIYRAIHREANT